MLARTFSRPLPQSLYGSMMARTGRSQWRAKEKFTSRQGRRGIRSSSSMPMGWLISCHGVKRFSLTDIPPLVKSSIPYPEPDLYDFNNSSDHNLPTYSNGQTVHPGDIVAWPKDRQAKLVIDKDVKGIENGRHWEPIWVHNKACDADT